MAINGQTLITNALAALKDASGVRWTRAEILNYLNDGQREVVLLVPEACTFNGPALLAAGKTKQTVPEEAIALIKVVRNTGSDGLTPGKAIRIISSEVMDAQFPDWHSLANTMGYIDGYVFDPQDPKTFYVVPKAPAASWYVDIVYSKVPASATDSTSSIGLSDIYANALHEYLLFRAYSKDAEVAANANLAVAHYQAFANSLGIKVTNEQVRNPNSATTAFNPGVQGAAKI